MFTTIGYFIEYLQNGKYIGTERVSEPDREVMGYVGRKVIILEEDKVIGKKKLKKGSQVTTILYPLNGKVCIKQTQN